MTARRAPAVARQRGRRTARAHRSSATTRSRCAEQMAERYADHPALRRGTSPTSSAATTLFATPTSARGLPHLAPGPLRDARRAQRRVGHGVLVAALHRLGADPAAARRPRPSPTRRSSSTSSASPPTRSLATFAAERDVLPSCHPSCPVTTNFMVTSTIHGSTTALGRRGRLRLQRPLPDARRTPRLRRAVLLGQPDRQSRRRRPWFLMEHSTSAVNWQPRNVAKPPGELLRDAFSHVAHGADAVLLLPVAAVAGRRGEVPLGMVPHAGHRHRGVPRGRRARRALRGRGEVTGSRGRAASRSSSTGSRGGRRARRRTRRTPALPRRRPSTGTRLCSTSASASTSSRRTPT